MYHYLFIVFLIGLILWPRFKMPDLSDLHPVSRTKNMESCKISIVNLIFIRFFLKRQCYHPPDIFIFSLTIADFFIGAIIMPIGLCKVRISCLKPGWWVIIGDLSCPKVKLDTFKFYFKFKCSLLKSKSLDISDKTIDRKAIWKGLFWSSQRALPVDLDKSIEIMLSLLR